MIKNLRVLIDKVWCFLTDNFVTELSLKYNKLNSEFIRLISDVSRLEDGVKRLNEQLLKERQKRNEIEKKLSKFLNNQK